MDPLQELLPFAIPVDHILYVSLAIWWYSFTLCSSFEAPCLQRSLADGPVVWWLTRQACVALSPYYRLLR